MEKCRLQQSYKTTPDAVVKSIQPKVRSGRLWSAEEALTDAKRDRGEILSAGLCGA